MESISCKDIIEKLVSSKSIDILSISLKELSEKINYSESAIVKALKQMGYKGFKDLKTREYLKMTINNKEEIKESLLIESLIATDRQFQDTKVLEMIVKEIQNYDEVFVQGFGRMRAVAQDFSIDLRQRGIKSCAIEFKEELPKNIPVVVIVLSSDLESWISHEFIEYNRKQNKDSKVIAITSHSIKDNKNIDIVAAGISFYNAKDEIYSEKKIIVEYIVSLILKSLNK